MSGRGPVRRGPGGRKKRKRGDDSSSSDEQRQRAALRGRKPTAGAGSSDEDPYRSPTPEQETSDSTSSSDDEGNLVQKNFSGRAAPGGGASWLDRDLNRLADTRRKKIRKDKANKAEQERLAREKAKADNLKAQEAARQKVYLDIARKQEGDDDSDDDETGGSFFAKLFPDEASKLKAKARAEAEKRKRRKFKCRYPVGTEVKYVGGGRYGQGQDVRWNDNCDRLRPGQLGRVIQVVETDENPYVCQFPERARIELREGDLQRVLAEAAPAPTDAGAAEGAAAGGDDDAEC